jgi:hypothetical protein
METKTRMTYLFLTYPDEKGWLGLTEAQRQEMMEHAPSHLKQFLASGKFLGRSPLHPTSEAVTVRLRDGKPVVTDGPFVETREQVGGYTLIEADDRDEAIAIAARFLGKRGPAIIEVREVAAMEFPTH